MVKNPPVNTEDTGATGLIPASGRSLEEKWQPSPVLLPTESHGQRSLVGYSPKGHKKSDTTEHTPMVCINIGDPICVRYSLDT